MLLTGTFPRSVDEKLRVALPKPLRACLGEPEPPALIVAPGTDGSLSVYSEAAFGRLAERLELASPTHEDVRAFSHGCVRVEEPEVLAKYVLRDYPEWDEPSIGAAMHSGVEKHVKLKEKIPVHIVYFTAWVDENGGLHFQPDIYGYDRALARRESAELKVKS